jgi:SRSO17 transposase
MNENELLECRDRLIEFLTDILDPLPPKVAGQWGQVYVRGLLLNGQRKSIEPMAKRMPEGNVQAMQQFVGQSPWPWQPVRERFAHRMVAAFDVVCAWIVDDTAFPKKGDHSVGVARQYCNSLGKVANCQIGVSLHIADNERSVPIDWSIYLSESWTQDRQRCRKAGVPEDMEFRTKWQLALEMMDRALVSGIPKGVVLADAAYGKVVEFRTELQARKLKYVVGIDKETKAWDKRVVRQPVPYPGMGRPPVPRYPAPEPPQSLVDIARSLPQERWRKITWRQGTQGPLSSRFARLRVQPSHGHSKNKEEQPELWLLIEWPEGEKEPTKYWVSNLAKTTSFVRLVRYAKQRAWIEQDYQELKQELGLDHFEGRGYPGWNHHVTLVSIAYGFLLLERIRSKKKLYAHRSDDPA